MINNVMIFGNQYDNVPRIMIMDENDVEQTFVNTVDATATGFDILYGKTAYVNGSKETGTIQSLSSHIYTPSRTAQTISSGYYLTGTQTIAGDNNLIGSNIKPGVSIFGVTGNIPTVGTHTYTPSSTTQTIINPGYYVNGYQMILGDSNLAPENIAKGVSIFGVVGTHEGSNVEYESMIVDLEARIADLERRVAILEGYHSSDENEVITYNDGELSFTGDGFTYSNGVVDINSPSVTYSNGVVDIGSGEGQQTNTYFINGALSLNGNGYSYSNGVVDINSQETSFDNNTLIIGGAQ